MFEMVYALSFVLNGTIVDQYEEIILWRIEEKTSPVTGEDNENRGSHHLEVLAEAAGCLRRLSHFFLD
jgi:hypothetical protein